MVAGHQFQPQRIVDEQPRQQGLAVQRVALYGLLLGGVSGSRCSASSSCSAFMPMFMVSAPYTRVRCSHSSRRSSRASTWHRQAQTRAWEAL